MLWEGRWQHAGACPWKEPIWWTEQSVLQSLSTERADLVDRKLRMECLSMERANLVDRTVSFVKE